MFERIIFDALQSGINFNIEQMADDAFWDNTKLFEETNKDQLQEGIMPDGSSTGSYKNYGGVSYKGGPLSPVDFKLSGEFYDSISAVITHDGVDIDSSDEKYPELVDYAGGEILGIDFDSQTANDLIEGLINSAQDSIRQQIKI